MEKEFVRLITGYLETQVGISDNFLSRKLTQHLKSNLLALNAQNLLVDAGTSNAKKLHQTQANPFFKSDEMLHELQINNAPRLSVVGWLKTE